MSHYSQNWRRLVAALLLLVGLALVVYGVADSTNLPLVGFGLLAIVAAALVPNLHQLRAKLNLTEGSGEIDLKTDRAVLRDEISGPQALQSDDDREQTPP
jgi:hypothetical protein